MPTTVFVILAVALNFTTGEYEAGVVQRAYTTKEECEKIRIAADKQFVKQYSKTHKLIESECVPIGPRT